MAAWRSLKDRRDWDLAGEEWGENSLVDWSDGRAEGSPLSQPLEQRGEVPPLDEEEDAEHLQSCEEARRGEVLGLSGAQGLWE